MNFHPGLRKIDNNVLLIKYRIGWGYFVKQGRDFNGYLGVIYPEQRAELGAFWGNKKNGPPSPEARFSVEVGEAVVGDPPPLG